MLFTEALIPGRVAWLGALILTSISGAPSSRAWEVDSTWDSSLARGVTREISFETDQGTWMSVDISRDGRWIVFDLLGQIYRIDARGDDAECLTQDSGVAINSHPAISPDGRFIAFSSDRKGQDNLWVMNLDGTSPRLIYSHMDSRVAEPVWSPDGKSVVATRRLQRAGLDLTHNTMWRYPLDGSAPEKLIQLPDKHADSPSLSGDGRYLYFVSRNFRGHFSRIQRLDLRSRSVVDITPSKDRESPYLVREYFGSSPLVEFAPQVSPNGRYLAFGRRLPFARLEYRGHQMIGRSALWIRDLQTGKERVLMDPITRDATSDAASLKQRVLPGYRWTFDGAAIVLSQGGRIRKVDVESGVVSTVPFKARVYRTISQQVTARHQLPDSFDVRGARWPATSPDGTQIVFEAVGRIWIKELPDGEPRMLVDRAPHSPAHPVEAMPEWSLDGGWVTFTTWDDEKGGGVWRIRPDGTGAEALIEGPGEYYYPRYSRNGATIFVNRWPAALAEFTDWLWQGQDRDAGWEWLEIDVGTHQASIVRADAALAIADDPRGDYRLYLQKVDPKLDVYGFDFADSVAFMSSQPEPKEPFLVSTAGTTDIKPSPGGKWVAISRNGNIFIAAADAAGPAAPPKFSLDSFMQARRRHGEWPIRSELVALTLTGGYFPRWASGTLLEWISGPNHYRLDAVTGLVASVPLGLTLPRAKASGRIALAGARILTMEEDGPIEQGTILVEDGRIACVGRCKLAEGDEVIDLTGKTVMPGMIDVHAHYMANQFGQLVKQRAGHAATYLAHGVTTTLELAPGELGLSVAAMQERIEAGSLVGPRAFSAGRQIHYWPHFMDEILTFADAKDEVAARTALGAISIKNYVMTTRSQRQMVIEAARGAGVAVTAEGKELNHNLGLVMDGTTGFEHQLQYYPLYRDVSEFLGQAKAFYSPTAWVGSHDFSGQYWIRSITQTDRYDEKLAAYMRWPLLQFTRTNDAAPLESYTYAFLAEGARDVASAGGYVTIGGHGDIAGRDSHFDLWTYALAMEPSMALKTATIWPARFIGLENEIGSIRPGKLADLVVLNANPLDDIRRTTDIRYVMKSGMLYDGSTLDELWPDRRPFGPKTWRRPELEVRDVKPDGIWDQGD